MGGSGGAGGNGGTGGTLGLSSGTAGSGGAGGTNSFTQYVPPPVVLTTSQGAFTPLVTAPSQIILPIIGSTLVRPLFFLNLPSALSGTTVIPTDKTPILQIVNDEVDQQQTAMLVGSITKSEQNGLPIGHAIFFAESAVSIVTAKHGPYKEP